MVLLHSGRTNEDILREITTFSIATRDKSIPHDVRNQQSLEIVNLSVVPDPTGERETILIIIHIEIRGDSHLLEIVLILDGILGDLSLRKGR